MKHILEAIRRLLRAILVVTMIMAFAPLVLVAFVFAWIIDDRDQEYYKRLEMERKYDPL